MSSSLSYFLVVQSKHTIGEKIKYALFVFTAPVIDSKFQNFLLIYFKFFSSASYITTK